MFTLSEEYFEKDPIVPIVYTDRFGRGQINVVEHLIVMNIFGMTCSHCVKVIEAALKSVHGSKTLIKGLIDVLADLNTSTVFIKISNPIMAQHVYHQAEETLRMVGYYSTVRHIKLDDILQNQGSEKKGGKEILDLTNKAFEKVSPLITSTSKLIDWDLLCKCSCAGMHFEPCPL